MSNLLSKSKIFFIRTNFQKRLTFRRSPSGVSRAKLHCSTFSAYCDPSETKTENLNRLFSPHVRLNRAPSSRFQRFIIFPRIIILTIVVAVDDDGGPFKPVLNRFPVASLLLSGMQPRFSHFYEARKSIAINFAKRQDYYIFIRFVRSRER